MGWRTDDKEWMIEREKEWERIEPNLKPWVEKKSTLNQQKKYYLTGKLTPKSDLTLFDKLWLHPDQSEETWQKLCDDVTLEAYKKARIKIASLYVSNFMGGIQGPLFNYLYPNEYQEGTFSFKGQQIKRSPKPPIDFTIMWNSKAKSWLRSLIEDDDCICPYSIDFWFSCLPYIPEEEFGLEYYEKEEDRFDRNLRNLRSKIFSNHSLLYLIAWFVEPRGLVGDNAKVGQFARKMYQELETRKLPSGLQKLWNYIKSEEACHLHVIENKHTRNFLSVVWHQDRPIESPEDFIKNIHETYTELGFVTQPFSRENLETVELSKHLSVKFISILGYNKGDSIRGYRYRLYTTPKFVNNNKDRIDVDIIIFSHPKGIEWNSDTPVAMLVPRPDDNYDLTGSSYYQGEIYELNYRLVRRTLAAMHGYVFKRYEKYEFSLTSRAYEEADPFVDVSYKPLKSGDKALLNTKKKDFSPIVEGDISSENVAKPEPVKKKKKVKDETGVRKTDIDTSSLRPLADLKKGLSGSAFEDMDEFKALMELCGHHGIFISEETKAAFNSPELIVKRMKASKYDYVDVDSPEDLDHLTLLEKLYAIIPMRFHFEHYEALDACEEEEILSFYPDFLKALPKQPWANGK